MLLLVRCRDPAKDIVKELASSKQPALVGPFENVTVSPALVSSDLGELCEHTATIAAWCELRLSQYPGVIFRAERYPWSVRRKPIGWPVDTLRITLPAAGVRDQLVAAWGPPVEAGGASFWFDPSKHLRVAMHPPKMPGDPAGSVDLDFKGYYPIDEFVESELTAWYGLTSGQLKDRAGARRTDEADEIHLWPFDTADFVQLTDSEYTGNKVTRYELRIHGDVDERAFELALAKKFGVQTSPSSRTFAGPPRIALRGSSCEVGISSEEIDSGDDGESHDAAAAAAAAMSNLLTGEGSDDAEGKLDPKDKRRPGKTLGEQIEGPDQTKKPAHPGRDRTR